MDEKKSPLPPSFTEVVIKHKSKGDMIQNEEQQVARGIIESSRNTKTARNCVSYCLLSVTIFFVTCLAFYCVMSLESTKSPNVIKIERDEFGAKPSVQPKPTNEDTSQQQLDNKKKNINFQVIVNGEPAINSNFDGNDNLTEISVNIARPDVEFQFLNDLTNMFNNNINKIESNFDLSSKSKENNGYPKPVVKVIDTYEIRKIPLVNSPSMLRSGNGNFPLIDDIFDSFFNFAPKIINNAPKTTYYRTTSKSMEDVDKVKKDKKISTQAPKTYTNDIPAFPHSIFKDFDSVFDVILDKKPPTNKMYKDEPVQKPVKLESNIPMFDIVTFDEKPFSNPFFQSFQKPRKNDKFRKISESRESDESINRFINSFFGIPTKTKYTKYHGKDSDYKSKGTNKGYDVEIPNIVLYENTYTPPCHLSGGLCTFEQKYPKNNANNQALDKNQKDFVGGSSAEVEKEVSTIPTTEVSPTTEKPTTAIKQEIPPTTTISPIITK